MLNIIIIININKFWTLAKIITISTNGTNKVSDTSVVNKSTLQNQHYTCCYTLLQQRLNTTTISNLIRIKLPSIHKNIHLLQNLRNMLLNIRIYHSSTWKIFRILVLFCIKFFWNFIFCSKLTHLRSTVFPRQFHKL